MRTVVLLTVLVTVFFLGWLAAEDAHGGSSGILQCGGKPYTPYGCRLVCICDDEDCRWIKVCGD